MRWKIWHTHRIRDTKNRRWNENSMYTEEWPHFAFITFRGYCLHSKSQWIHLLIPFITRTVFTFILFIFFLAMVTCRTKINFHLWTWWIIIAIFTVLNCIYFWYGVILWANPHSKRKKIDRSVLTMAILVACRASLSIFDKFSFSEYIL